MKRLTVREFYERYGFTLRGEELKWTTTNLLEFARDYAAHLQLPCVARDTKDTGAGKMWCHACLEYHPVSTRPVPGRGDGPAARTDQ